MFKKIDEMNVLGISVLQDIRKVKGFEEAIIAGGFVRDHIMRGQFKDIDIFVPFTDEKKFHKSLAHLNNSPFTAPQFKRFNDYGHQIQVLKFDCQYMGIDVDLMGEFYDPKISEYKTFGEHTASKFSYGIDMAWYDGEQITANKQFDHDYKNNFATLVELPNLGLLPGALRKYERLIEKYPDRRIKFRSTVLSLKNEKKTDTKTDDKFKNYQYPIKTIPGIGRDFDQLVNNREWLREAQIVREDVARQQARIVREGDVLQGPNEIGIDPGVRFEPFRDLERRLMEPREIGEPVVVQNDEEFNIEVPEGWLRR